MANVEKEYVKLPGRGIRREGLISSGRVFTTLWLGKDHLLYIENSGGYSEEYKRFYYRDIQALVLRKTQNGFILNLVMGSFFAILALCGLAVGDAVGRITLFFIAGIFGLILLLNSLFGPTCVCNIKTAVQTEELSSLRRLRRANKVLNLLRSRITQAQGDLSLESLRAGLQSNTGVSDPALPPVISPSSPAIPPPPRVEFSANANYHGGAHMALFYLLMFDGLQSCVYLARQFDFLRTLNALVNVAELILIIIALARQRHSPLNQKLQRLTWVTLWVYGGNLAISIFYTFILSLAKTGFSLAQRSPWDDIGLAILAITSTVIALGLGVMGTLALRDFRSQPPASTAAETV